MTILDERVLVLDPETRSVPMSRASVHQVLIDWNQHHARENAALIVTELVTNAVRYARSPVRLVVQLDDVTLIFSVTDARPDLLSQPLAEPVEDDSERGRGLELVAFCSADWGVRRTATHKTVWFTLDQTPAA